MEPKSSVTRRKILVVEDDPEGALYLQGVLEEAGYLVIAAHTGKTAVEWLREPAKPDLVILDRTLPDLDGLVICKAIKDNIGTKHIPVVILTAHAGNDSRIKASQIKADLYLNKPIKAEDLLGAVGGLLAQKKEPRKGVLNRGGLELDPDRRSVFYNGACFEPLAEKRFHLLYLLALYPSQALERGYLISELRCQNDRDREIDVLVSLLRKELFREFGANLIETVPGVGYRLQLPSLTTKSS